MQRIASVNQDKGISPGRNKGAAVHLAAMREAFSALGHEVVCFDEPDPDRLREKLATAHARRPFNLVYERYSLGNITGAQFAKSFRIPLVVEANAPLASEQARHRQQAETAANRENDQVLFGRADLVVAVSSAVSAYAIERGAWPQRVIVRANGIDSARFNLAQRARATKPPTVPADAVVLGFHGRERPWHGFDQLVTSFKNMLARFSKLHLMVIGQGEFKSLGQLPRFAYTRIDWQPHEKMPSLVSAFDVLPLTYPAGQPCYFSPLKLAEAMACGVVPVVPDLGDLGATVRHETNGLLYPAGDMQQFEKLILKLANDSGFRLKLSTKAADDASRNSWERIARDVLQSLAIRESAP